MYKACIGSVGAVDMLQRTTCLGMRIMGRTSVAVAGTKEIQRATGCGNIPYWSGIFQYIEGMGYPGNEDRVYDLETKMLYSVLVSSSAAALQPGKCSRRQSPTGV